MTQKFFVTALLTIAFSVDSEASFKETWTRYPSPHGTLSLLRQAFPFSPKMEIRIENCLKILPENSSLLGAITPADGIPLHPQPEAAFLIWYMKCLTEMAKLEFESISKDDKKFAAIAGAKAAEIGANAEWNRLQEDVKARIVDEMLIQYLGPEESYEYLNLSNHSDLRASIFAGIHEILRNRSSKKSKYLKEMGISRDRPQLGSVLVLIKISILSRDEFLLE